MIRAEPLPVIDHSPQAWGGFVPTPENASAFLAIRTLARQLAKSPRRVSQPLLYLFGPPGVGKSHLTQQLIEQSARNERVLTSRLLPVRELAESDDLTSPDLLILEDLQFLAQKSDEKLVQLLDDRSRRRLPVVVTANVGPAGLTRHSRRLTSRLTAGLVVPMHVFSTDSRLLLIDRFAANNRIQLEPDARWQLAARPDGGARTLLGYFENLRPLARKQAVPLSWAMIEPLIVGPAVPQSLVRRIISAVAKSFGVTPAALLGPSRARTVLVPRQVAMFLSREVGRMSFPQVGAAFGGRDHTTVVHACKKVREAAKDDARLRKTLVELRSQLG